MTVSEGFHSSSSHTLQ